MKFIEIIAERDVVHQITKMLFQNLLYFEGI